MALTNKIVLMSVFWLIISLQLAGCTRPSCGVGGDSQDFEKGSNSGGAAVVGGRPVASGPNRFHHHFAIRAASPPPAPESEP
ncbi:hypothetical protein WN943_009528 [Citrus x changshan-huyou]